MWATLYDGLIPVTKRSTGSKFSDHNLQFVWSNFTLNPSRTVDCMKVFASQEDCNPLATWKLAPSLIGGGGDVIVTVTADDMFIFDLYKTNDDWDIYDLCHNTNM